MAKSDKNEDGKVPKEPTKPTLVPMTHPDGGKATPKADAVAVWESKGWVVDE